MGTSLGLRCLTYVRASEDAAVWGSGWPRLTSLLQDGMCGIQVLLPSVCYRMGCVRSRFFRDEGKISKTEPCAGPHTTMYVPDPMTSSKPVSGGEPACSHGCSGAAPVPLSSLLPSPAGQDAQGPAAGPTCSSLCPQDPSRARKSLSLVLPAARTFWAHQPGLFRPGLGMHREPPAKCEECPGS